jgi:hypothetical protein
MNRSVKQWLLAGSVVAMAILPGFAQSITPAVTSGLQVEGIRVPEYNSDGTLKSEFFGDTARPLDNGLMELTNLRLNFYKEGRLDGFILTPRCIYDKNTKLVFSNADVTMRQGDILISGTGFRWFQETQVVEILNRCSLIVNNARIWADKGAGHVKK